MTRPPWPSIERARRQERPRLPFVVDQACVGSVAAEHRDALLDWPDALQVGTDGVRLTIAEPDRDAALAAINTRLRDQGLVLAWRDETYPVIDPASGRLLARMERAASRFWGTLTFGAHANGWLAGDDGAPAALWIAQRSFDKATDPGAHDNLVGGGVPLGQTPFQTLVREGWEEAGLPPAVMQRARPGRVLELRRDIPEGLQVERIHAYDLLLQRDERPLNQDGEVHAFERLPLAEALALAAGDTMTVDAALVTLDFALRRGLLPASARADVAARAAGLWVGEASAG